MIINSDALRTAPGPNGLIHHLLGKPEDNETIQLLSGSQDNIRFAYDDARSHNSLRAVLHIKLSPDTKQSMNPKNWSVCVDQLAGEYGFTPSAATIIEHRKKGRVHRHIVVPFVHPVTGKKLDMGFSKLRDEKCARLLEIQLGHQLTPMKPGHRQAVSAYLQKSGQEQAALHVAALPDSGIGTSLMAHQKAKRLGRDLADEKQLIKSLFQQSDSPAAFKAALKTQGLDLQQGDKPGRYIIRNSEGELIGSANRLTGLRVKAFQQYMEIHNETIQQKAPEPHRKPQQEQETGQPAQNQGREQNGKETAPEEQERSSGFHFPTQEAGREQKAPSLHQPEPADKTNHRREVDQLLPEDTPTKQPSGYRSRRTARPLQSGTGGEPGRPHPASARHTRPAGRAATEQRREADTDRKIPLAALTQKATTLRTPITRKASLITQARLRAALTLAALPKGLLPQEEPKASTPHNSAPHVQATQSRSVPMPTQHTTSKQSRGTGRKKNIRFAEQVEKLRKPITRQASLIAQIRLGTGLDPAYFADLLPRSEVSEPVSSNTSYRARLMCRYYGLPEPQYDDTRELPNDLITERAKHIAWITTEPDHLRIRLKNGDLFQDYGNRMTCPPGPIQPSTAREIVLSAKAKGWPSIQVTGSQEFKDEIAIHAYLNEIPCDYVFSEEVQGKINRILEESNLEIFMKIK